MSISDLSLRRKSPVFRIHVSSEKYFGSFFRPPVYQHIWSFMLTSYIHLKISAPNFIAAMSPNSIMGSNLLLYALHCRSTRYLVDVILPPRNHNTNTYPETIYMYIHTRMYIHTHIYILICKST